MKPLIKIDKDPAEREKKAEGGERDEDNDLTAKEGGKLNTEPPQL